MLVYCLLLKGGLHFTHLNITMHAFLRETFKKINIYFHGIFYGQEGGGVAH